MSFPFDPTRQLIVLKVKIFGPAGSTTINMALDTGASSTLVGWDALTVAGYEPQDAIGQVEMTTGSGAELVSKIKLKRLVALGKRRRGLEIVAHTLPKGASVDGLLGLDFFRKTRLTIDFRKNLLKLD